MGKVCRQVCRRVCRQDAKEPTVWMDERAAAEYIGRAVRTMKGWRAAGKIITRRGTEPIPPYYRRGGSIWYSRQDLDDWIHGGRCSGV